MIKKIVVVVTILLLVFIYWYNFIALKNFPMELKDILREYQYSKRYDIRMEMTEISPRIFTFTYQSFDGSIVNGQISYPSKIAETYPVLLGVSAMGRSYIRWWVDSFKERPTVTQVNKITTLANSNGYVVISIDARFHGKRKNPERTLSSIMNDLSFFGNKVDYEAMIRDTVLDHRVLLDWTERQDNLAKNNTKVVGYSMGGQIALILGSIDERIEEVISIVPPYIDDRMAVVAPKNVIPLLKDKEVVLLTADDDENASIEENNFIFDLIPSKNKKKIDFEGGHILPENYVEHLATWFE